MLAGQGLVNYPTEWWHWSFGDRYWALLTGARHALYGPVVRGGGGVSARRAARSRQRGSTSSRTRLDIDLDAVARNTRLLADRAAGELMAVVKADGFGHGAVDVARTALANGATRLGVTTLDEAWPLRDAGLAVPLLSWLNPVDADFATAAARDVDVAVPEPPAPRRGRGRDRPEPGAPRTWTPAWRATAPTPRAGRRSVARPGGPSSAARSRSSA